MNRLVRQLAERPWLWDENPLRKRLPSGPFSAASDIWVRYNDLERLGNDRAAWNAEHVPVWYPAWEALPALRPIIFGLMSLVEGEMLGGVLITKVPSGQGIAAHRDEGWHVEYYDKFYLSLLAPAGATFICHSPPLETLAPKAGEIWRFDNRKVHSVENKGDGDRITLIMCIRTEKFRRTSGDRM